MASAVYRPRQPEGEVLHQLVRDHFETFRARAAARREGQGLPQFVEREFREFLTCGSGAGGFARFRCADCGADRLVRLIVPEPPTPAEAPEPAVVSGPRERPANRTWAELMQRSFGFDVLACPRCGGRLRLVALIQSAAVITRILRHLQLPEARPTMRPSRDPPLALREMDDGAVFAD